MKTIKTIFFNAVVVSALSLAPTAWAQTSFGTSTVTSPVFQVVDNSVGGNTTYNCSATVDATMSAYVTQNGNYNFTATLTANCSLVSGPAPGVGVLIFGQNGTLSHSTSIGDLSVVSFGGSSVTIGSPDFWDVYSGSYEATYEDYNRDANSASYTLNFGVGAGPLSLSITPQSSDQTIILAGLPSGQNGQILMTNTLSDDVTASPGLQTRFSGVFENGDYVKLNNIGIYDETGGGEIGYVTLNIPLTGAHTYNFLGDPTVDSFTAGPTMSVQVPYVRDQGIPMPTHSITQSANQVQVGNTVTLNVTITNNSQAVSLGNASQQVVVGISYDNSYFSLASGYTSSINVATIPTNSSHTFSFQLVAQAATPVNGSSPQISVTTGWGSPATTKNYYTVQNLSASQAIVVTPVPTRIISLSGNLAFGNVTVNSSAQRTLTINNTGNSTMTVSSISYPSGFSGSWSGTISAGNSQNVTVMFSPTSATSYGGTVTVNSDMTSGVNTIAASGTGMATTRIISLGGNLAFGNVTVNSSAQNTLTIYNNGNSTMTVSSISYPSGFSGSWSGTISAGNSQNVTVMFSPTSATSYGGTVTVNSDMTSGVNTISASGMGTVSPTPIISLSGNLAFGNVSVNSSAQNTLTINNTGNSTMTVSSISYPSGFSGNWSGTVVAGGSQPVAVTFSPTSATSYGGTVTVNSDATSGGNTISASGTGVAAPAITPQITNVVFSGSAGNYTITVSGSGLGNLAGLPIINTTTTNLSLVDFTQLGHAEWGYSGDGNHLTYQSWADNQFQVSGFGGQPGDAITITIWSPTTGAGVTWGGNVPGGSGMPQITSVIFLGGGTNLQVRIAGIGFGNAPTNLPFIGDVNNLIFQDHSTHSAVGSFEAGGNIWGIRSADSVTLKYQSWSDKQIVIGGFAGSYGQGNNVLQNGDPVTIVVWNSNDTSDAGSQTAWGGFVSESPLLIGSMSVNGFIVNAFGPAGSNCVFQASADLRTWVSIYTNTISSSGSFQFVVPATNSCCFFRSFIQ